MGIQAYQNQEDWEILGASPLELVLALYRGALQQVRKAKSALAAGKIRERSNEITKACAILQELTLSLDRSHGGEVAQNLSELYVYMHRRLGEANIEQTRAPLDEVEHLLKILLQAWEQVETQPQKLTAGEPLLLSA